MKHLDDLGRDLNLGLDGNAPTMNDTRSLDGMTVEPSPIWHEHVPPPKPAFIHPRVGAIKNFFLIALLFLLVSVGYFVYIFGRTGGSASEDRISVDIIGTSFVTSGQSSNYEVVVGNTNRVPLEDAIVVLSVPVSGGLADEVQVQQVGIIESGEQKRLLFPVTLYGAQFEDKQLTAKLEYSFPGSRATLVSSTQLPVRIAQSPVTLSLRAPDTLVVGQEVSVDIAITSATAISNVGIKVEYPDGFEVTSSSLPPSAGKYFWEFSKLTANKETPLRITGVFRGLPVVGNAMSFRVAVGSLSRDERILDNIFATSAKEVVVSNAALNAELVLGRNTGAISAVFPDSDLSGIVYVTNTTNGPIRNAQVSLNLRGALIDPRTPTAVGAFYDSSRGQLVWSPASGTADLQVIAPGTRVSLPFSLATSATFPRGETSTLTVSLQGSTDAGDVVSAVDVDSMQLQQTARLSLLQSTLYTDGVFKNTGPLPPAVDQATSYTIRWVLPRQVVDFDTVSVTAVLPVYVEWLNQKYPDTADIVYVPGTRTITWTPGTVAGSAKFDPRIEFQVRVTPGLQQVSTSPAIVESVVVRGRNTLTNESVEYTRQNHTTKVRGDSVDANGSVTTP